MFLGHNTENFNDKITAKEDSFMLVVEGISSS